MIFMTDMLDSPIGSGFTRFVLTVDGRQVLDFSADDRKITGLAAEAEQAKAAHGAAALERRVERDFPRAVDALSRRNDSDPLLKLVVTARVASGYACRSCDDPLPARA